ncbi:MAG: hypothetical protein HYU78_00535 [Rhodocyclales bacterium]|nr:hypothetical protein [Rhodocyclales bacterium]
MARIQNSKWHQATQNPESLLAEICDHVAEGRGLVSWTKAFGVAYSTAWQWLNDDPSRERAYHAARITAADYLAEQALQIIDAEPERLESGAVDNAAVSLQKARFDARRWQCAKLRPDRYGESVTVNDGREISLLGALQEARQRVRDMGFAEQVTEALTLPIGNRTPSDQ